MEFKDQKEFDFVWRNNGVAPDGSGERIGMTDALAWPSSTQFFPITVENYVREAMEPLLIGTSLLQRINYKVGQTISFPSIGAVVAADIPEGQEYPEAQLNFGPGAVIATIGKSGIAMKFTEEMKRYSQYDVVALHLRALGKALARHKEYKIMAMLQNCGVVTHDNITPANSVFGVTTGRGLSGAANGALILDNILEAYGQIQANGFTPDVILLHPMTYVIWMTDPLLQALALAGNGGQWYNYWNGNAENTYPWSQGAQGKMGPGNGLISSSSDPKTFNVNASPKIPNYLGLPLRVVVSPFVPYNHTSKLTDIFLADSNNIGALIVDEDPVMDTVEDKLRDMTKIKIRERYTVAPFNDGNAIAVLKNIKVTQNKLLTPVQAVGPTINTDITRSTQVYAS